ncbi:hypothetical protein NBRC116188_09160 [Oceaniserpentilla sp. 4NH20-0058]|uniref:hypothetical protein n=1 Tax=Oceaniserpentilla sp. 4NH20-0058 TaxID=3127660 RepID=UPI0031027A92
MRYTLYFLFLIISSQSYAAESEDVIYKKDGSILRGSIIEQNFESGIYKIEIEGGSVFVIKQEDVTKITKETSKEPAPTVSQNNPTPTVSSPYVEPEANQYDNVIDGVFFLGSANRTSVETSTYYETQYEFSGFNFAGQHNFNQHIALYTDINYTNLSKGTRSYSSGYERALSKNELKDATQSSVQLSLLLSTNHYRGWQFYTGVGKFSERIIIETGEDSETFSGEVYQLGMGYSWHTCQLLLRASILDSDYPEQYTNNTIGNLQLGFNF